MKAHLRERTRSIFPYLIEDVIESHIEAVANQLVEGLLMQSTVLLSGAFEKDVIVAYKVGEL